MSSITATGPKNDRKYRARYRTPDGASRSKTFARKVDAEQFLASVTVSVSDGSYVDRGAGRITFGEYAQNWASSQPHRETTKAGVVSILKKHIIPAFGHRPIAQIRTSEVQAWVAGLDLAPSTTVVVYGKLAAIFAAAVEDRLIARTPCSRRIRLPRPDGAEVVPMSPLQVRTMAEAVNGRYRALVILLAGSGMRPGEALGLTVDRVEFLKRSIRIDQQLVTVAGSPPRLAPVKTPSSVRTIPVPQSVLDELAMHLETYGREHPLGLVFVDGRGQPIHRSALGHMWRRSAAKANVVDFTPHSLRHYAASVMIAQGASVKAVQRHLGHASATTTLDTYAHLFPDSEDITRRALEAGIEAVVNTQFESSRQSS
jgi:integrase